MMFQLASYLISSVNVPLLPSSSVKVAIGTASLCIFVTIISMIYQFTKSSDRRINGVPVVPRNSIFGFTTPFMSNAAGDSHRRMLALTEQYGKIFQFSFLGQHVVAINDKTMAKQALKSANGKGYPFHVRYTAVSVIFSLADNHCRRFKSITAITKL